MAMATERPLFKENLKRLREESGFTQDQLAQASGISLSLITKMERGITDDPRLSTLRALAGALGVTIDALAYTEKKDGDE